MQTGSNLTVDIKPEAQLNSQAQPTGPNQQSNQPTTKEAQQPTSNNLELLRANNRPYKLWLMTELNTRSNLQLNELFNVRLLSFVKGFITRTTMYDIWDNIKARKQQNKLTFSYNSDFNSLVLKCDDILASQLAIAILEKDDECCFIDISKLVDCSFKEKRNYFFLGNIERIEHGIPCLFAKAAVPAFNLEYDLFIKTRYIMEKKVYPMKSKVELDAIELEEKKKLAMTENVMELEIDDGANQNNNKRQADGMDEEVIEIK